MKLIILFLAFFTSSMAYPILPLPGYETGGFANLGIGAVPGYPSAVPFSENEFDYYNDYYFDRAMFRTPFDFDYYDYDLSRQPRGGRRELRVGGQNGGRVKIGGRKIGGNGNGRNNGVGRRSRAQTLAFVGQANKLSVNNAKSETTQTLSHRRRDKDDYDWYLDPVPDYGLFNSIPNTIRGQLYVK